MKIVCLSDTHTFHKEIEVPDGDVLVHAGDATINGEKWEVGDFAAWFGGLPHKYKIFVAGNHDWLFERNRRLAESILGTYGIIYLQDGFRVLDGVKFYGSPWQPEFFNWAFNLRRGSSELYAKWDAIPDNADILITHSPPEGVLDQTPDARSVGCHGLFERVTYVRPKIHVFGHIHHSYGQCKILGTTYINASICDEAYKATNKPIVIEI